MLCKRQEGTGILFVTSRRDRGGYRCPKLAHPGKESGRESYTLCKQATWILLDTSAPNTNTNMVHPRRATQSYWYPLHNKPEVPWAIQVPKNWLILGKRHEGTLILSVTFQRYSGDTGALKKFYTGKETGMKWYPICYKPPKCSSFEKTGRDRHPPCNCPGIKTRMVRCPRCIQPEGPLRIQVPQKEKNYNQPLSGNIATICKTEKGREN